MNEAQTLINLEKFMSSVCRRDYHWEDFAPDYDQWLDDARAVYDDGLKYSPLIQAYFDLIPGLIGRVGIYLRMTKRLNPFNVVSNTSSNIL